MKTSRPETCTRCGFLLNRHGLCARPECSSNRPTHRPPTSKPAQTEPRADASQGEEVCSACNGRVPSKARYCPYCRAPRRASATVAYFGIDQQAPRPPRVPSIPDDGDAHPPHQSGTRCKEGESDESRAELAAKK